MPKFKYRFEAFKRDPKDPDCDTIDGVVESFEREIEAPNEELADQKAYQICRESSDLEKRFFAGPIPPRKLRFI